jgi:UDP-glucose 4-epimerase
MDTDASHVVITGGAGFIGSELARQAALKGLDVTIVDNLANGKRANVEDIEGDNVRLDVVDIRNLERMSAILEKADIIFHLACLGVRHSLHSPRENHEVNATATLDLLMLARSLRVRRFVCVSSSEVYGTARHTPMSEEHPTYPNTVYGASKLAGECYTRSFCQAYGYPTTVVRPFNTYGPRCHHEGDSGEVIPKFMLRAMAGKPMIIFGDGTQTRDFSYVTDTARGILQAGFSEETIGETVNLGTGHETSINEVSQEISSLLDKKDQMVVHDRERPGDVLRLCSDISKAKRLFDYKPLVSLREGLTELKQWYLDRDIEPMRLLEEEVVRNWEK